MSSISAGTTSSLYWIRHAYHTDVFSQGYVGVSNNFKARIRHHRIKPQNLHLGNAINKYGWDGLVKEVVIVAADSYCLEMEAKLRPKEKIGWNVAVGGGKPPVTRWNLGKNMPDEVKRKVSIAKKGCKGTRNGMATPQERRERISQSLKGNLPWNKGVPATPEHAAASRIAMLGKKHSDETKRKMSLAQKGKIMSDKAKANMSQGQRNVPKVTCPQCSKVGGYRAMKRWHFDNCKGGA